MNETKRRLETFSIYDHTGLEHHLARMAEQGWLLEKVDALWTYRRTEPKKLTFSVCYFPKASVFDPEPSEEQQTFYDFCAHTGWTLAASNAQLQVFYNERENPVPIETDPVTEVDAIHRTMTRGILPSQALLLMVSLLNFAMMIARLLSDPIGELSNTSFLFMGMCFTLLDVLLGVEWGNYFLWHHRAVRAAEQGEFLETHSHRSLQIAALVVLMVGLVCYLFSIFASGNRMLTIVMILMFFVYLPAVFFLVYGIKGLLKRKKAPTGVNRVVTYAGSFVMSLILVGVITLGVLYGSSHGWFGGDQETYEYNGQTFTACQDELPLTIEDLMGVDGEYDGYIRQAQVDESFLLARRTMDQSPRFDAPNYSEMPHLRYVITVVKAPFLYDFCRDALISSYDERTDDRIPEGNKSFYQPTDPHLWGAVEAYQAFSQSNGFRSHFLLCYKERLVCINFDSDWDVTPAMMAIVGEKLGGQ